MAITIPTVQPGDLIKAEVWNSLIQQLADLDKRVAALEGITPGSGSKLAITGLSQTTARVGDKLTVFGVNFGIPLLNNISIDTTNVSVNAIDTAQSNDRQLVFTIPSIATLPAQGANVTLRINNNNGSDQRTLFLQPPTGAMPNGNLVMKVSQWADAVDNIGPGQWLIIFTVNALTNIAETYNITTLTSIPGGTAVAVDTNGVPITTVRLSPVSASDPGTDVRVLLTIPNGATGTQSVTLALQSQLNPALNNPATQSFQIGSPAPQPGTIGFTIGSVKPAPATVSNGQLRVSAGVPAIVNMAAVLPATAPTGAYTVSTSFPAGASGWVASVSTGATVNGGPGQQPQFTLSVTGSAGASDTTMTVSLAFAGAGGTPFGVLPVRVHVL